MIKKTTAAVKEQQSHIKTNLMIEVVFLCLTLKLSDQRQRKLTHKGKKLSHEATHPVM